MDLVSSQLLNEIFLEFLKTSNPDIIRKYLDYAITTGSFDNLNLLVNSLGINYNALLSYAVMQENLNLVQYCLTKHITKNYINSNNKTALIYACQFNKDTFILKLLVEAGWDIYYKNLGKNKVGSNISRVYINNKNWTTTALNLGSNFETNKTLLMYSAELGKANFVEYLISTSKANIDWIRETDFEGKTALDYAIASRNLDIIKLLKPYFDCTIGTLKSIVQSETLEIVQAFEIDIDRILDTQNPNCSLVVYREILDLIINSQNLEILQLFIRKIKKDLAYCNTSDCESKVKSYIFGETSSWGNDVVIHLLRLGSSEMLKEFLTLNPIKYTKEFPKNQGHPAYKNIYQYVTSEVSCSIENLKIFEEYLSTVCGLNLEEMLPVKEEDTEEFKQAYTNLKDLLNKYPTLIEYYKQENEFLEVNSREHEQEFKTLTKSKGIELKEDKPQNDLIEFIDYTRFKKDYLKTLQNPEKLDYLFTDELLDVESSQELVECELQVGEEAKGIILNEVFREANELFNSKIDTAKDLTIEDINNIFETQDQKSKLDFKIDEEVKRFF